MVYCAGSVSGSRYEDFVPANVDGVQCLTDALCHPEPRPPLLLISSLADALHLSFDEILLTLEEELLIDQLNEMLEKMDTGIEDLRRQSRYLGRTTRRQCAVRRHGRQDPRGARHRTP